MTTTKKASDALAAEAADEDREVSFEYDGVSYTVSTADLRDLDVLEGFEEGKIVAPLKAILGAAQWATFRSVKRDANDLGELAKLMFDELGLKLGE